MGMAALAAATARDEGPAAFLGVARSLTGCRWVARGAGDAERIGLAIAQRLGVPEIVGRLLAQRGIALDGAERFLAPTLREQLPDPLHLRDMAVAAERLVQAVTHGERVAVFADYDVDGATAAALLARFLGRVGSAPEIYVPDRIDEGYGPNPAAMRQLAERGVRLVVTVDCGVTAFAALAAAREAGLDVVVVDHHAAEPALPPAVAVVDPNRVDETSPHGHLAAVGVAFLLVVAVNAALRAAGWYGGARPEPDLRAWLDLVALGTVCDVVPLVGVNRALVAQGLKVLARRANPGLAALADLAGIDEAPSPYHLGFILGPRVNAGGRVGQADLGARLLSTDDPAEARSIAETLDRLNRERQRLEQTALDGAVEQVEARGAGADRPVIVAAAEGWHPGVIGIVAGRLKERYRRPACVVALEGGVGKGSGRSVPGADLGQAVIAARQAGLLIAGGGHPMAAGFTVAESALPAFEAFLAERLAGAAADTALAIDGLIATAAATPGLVAAVGRVGPFGAGNAEPRFALAGQRVVRADPVGERHVRCVLSSGDGGRLKAIAFRALDGALGPALLASRGATLHVAGHLRADTWQGRDGVQLFLDDAAPAG